MKAACVVLLLFALGVLAAPGAAAKVYHENTDDLPPGCDEVVGEHVMTVHGGREFAGEFPGTLFVFDQRVFDLPACTRVTVTFENTDQIRHQFMVHGVWPAGQFVVEVDGPGQDTGTFILPAQKGTILVHCGLPQHQQKGMKAEFLIDGGVGHLPNLPGYSGIENVADDAATGGTTGSGSAGLAAILTLVGIAFLGRRRMH